MTKNEMVLDTVRVSRVAEMNDTAKAIFADLNDRERLRDRIDLTRHYNKLVASNPKVNRTDYYATWKELEKQNVGALIYGRNGNSDRFLFEYNLKWIGTLGTTPELAGTSPYKVTERFTPGLKVVSPQRRTTRGRPPGSRNVAIKAANFDRSEHMKKIWANRKATDKQVAAMPAPKQTIVQSKEVDTNEVIGLLQKLFKALKVA